MLIEGIPSGWELVRIGKPKLGEYFIDGKGEATKSAIDFTHTCFAIVRRIEAPSPGEGWRWLELGEKTQAGDKYCICAKCKDMEPGLRVLSSHLVRRRIGPRLRKVGERLQEGDWMKFWDGEWKLVPADMIGMEIVGGQYYATK
jgi:hypothetical protein